jgi:MFS family permease
MVLGYVFGARAGTLAAAVPFATIALVDIALFETQRTQLVVATLFVVLTLGFTAWLVGSLRDRYARRPAGPNGRPRSLH